MTGADAAGGGADEDAPRRAIIRTCHDDPVAVARAVRPDNTDAIRTTVTDGESGGRPSSDGSDGGRVRTCIERPTTGGLRSTVDDYVVNLRVAETVAATARGEDATDVDARDADEAMAERTGASHEQNDSDITTHDTDDT